MSGIAGQRCPAGPRRTASSNPGRSDGLDDCFARTLGVGEALRLVVRCASRDRSALRVEADAQRG